MSFICQTPREHCSGSVILSNAGLRTGQSVKTHESGQKANACYANYLVNKLGYKRVPFQNRTLLGPAGGPALILPKRNKPDLRKGKRGGKDSKGGTRLQPRRKGGKSGLIIG